MALVSTVVNSDDRAVPSHVNNLRTDLTAHTHEGTDTALLKADSITTVTNARTLTLPTSGNDTLVGKATTDVLTNKTLTSPTLTSPILNGNVFFNDTANALMTQGLTLQQDANDDEILAFKSSDVAHGVTDVAETDTYAAFSKVSALGGGLLVRGFTDTDAAAGRALLLSGLVGEAVDTTKSTAGIGAIEVYAQIKSGTGVAPVGTDGNLFVVSNNGTARFIHDAEGTLHSIGGSQTERFGNGESLLVAPTIADFTNANHDHGDADDGGALISGITLTSPIINTPSDSGQVYSGTYTPTLTLVTNLNAATVFTGSVFQITRIGARVFVSGEIATTPTGAGAAEVGISLPVASNFTNEGQCNGGGDNGGADNGRINGDTTNDRASFQWNSGVGASNFAVWFSYLIV